jgi:hypothetical protein
MLKYLLIFFFVLKLNASFCQGFFISVNSGDWNNTTSWTLVAGTSSLNYPVAGDSVIVQSAHAIMVTSNAQCQSLTIKGASSISINSSTSFLSVTNDLLVTESSNTGIAAGALTVTGNITINQKSTVTQTGGVFSVLGLVFLNSPSTSTGNTTLAIDAGVFSCVGGTTITATTFPAGRIAELKIGNSAVTVVGALTTISSNAKITFTGMGVLTLAGIITIPNPLSFTAGNGRVVYIGIPGTNQAVAPLTYNRLVIAGIGNGSKTISGNVAVTDSLVLLSDTLQTTGSGTLSLSNNATIVKTTGKLLNAPVYLGQVDILYNDIQKDTTGPEMPAAPNLLRNLLINNVAGVTMSRDITINNKLTLQNGELFTDNFILTINNPLGGATVDPAVERINGFVNGKISRTIGANPGVRIFPFGIGLLQGYREYKIEYTIAPTVSGTLNVQHFNNAAVSQSGLPLSDGPVTIANSLPYYWQADAGNGLTGGIYNVTLTAEGSSGITDFTLLRTLKRPSTGGAWVLDGTAGVNSGTNASPVVVRNSMSNFSQFAIGNSTSILPLTLVSFNAKAGNGNTTLKWKTAHEINTDYFSIEKSGNGFNFTEIGKIAAHSSGELENSYQYIDTDVSAGKYYYRLKIVDKDGGVTKSVVVYVDVTKPARLGVYPQITQSIIYVSSEDNSTIFLHNLSGQIVKQLNNGFNDLSECRNGLYIIRTAKGQTVKIIKQ